MHPHDSSPRPAAAHADGASPWHARRALAPLAALLVAATALAAPAAAQTFTVTGLFQYEDKGWGYNGWSGSDPLRPIRKADVVVIDDTNTAILGSGSTADDGTFSIECTSAGVVDVVVRVDADTDLAGSFQRIRVTTEGNVEYAAFSPVFAAHDTSLDLDVGTTDVLLVTSGGDEANPFNMLDMGVAASEYITGPAGDAPSAGNTVRLFWPGGGGSFASGNSAHMASDDGYDDAVILHELGHVFHNIYSDSDSPGGTHFFGDSDQDPRLSFGEGWATAFAGMVMDAVLERTAIYLDADGSANSGGAQLRLRLETATPYSGDAFGGADEVAVACTVFDLVDHVDSPDQDPGVEDDPVDDATLFGALDRHEAHWQVFTGPVQVAGNLTINDLWNGWFSLLGADGQHALVRDVFALRRLDFVDDADEPNEVHAEAVPFPIGTWVTERTLYAGVGDPPAPGTGDKDWYSVQLVKGSQIEIETRYPNAASDADTQADTFLDLWDVDVVKHAEAEVGGTGRNARITGFVVPHTGEWRFRVRSLHSYRTYGRYDARLVHLFENHLPQVTSAPVAAPDTVVGGGATSLSAVASDADAGHTLTWLWTPLDGGSISGSGSSVTFTAPAVTETTLCDVQLVVVDPLGAESGPEIVTVTVEPLPAGGQVASRPLPGGALAPLPPPTVGGSLGPGGGGGLLDVALQGLDLPTHATLLVVIGRELDGGGPRPRLVGQTARAPSPVPEALLPLTLAGSGTASLRVPLPEAAWSTGRLYLQVLGRDGARALWSPVMELTPEPAVSVDAR